MKPIIKQLSRFIVAGFSAVGVDSLVYFISIELLNHSTAKAVSFLCGSVVAYLVNRFWTFEQKNHSWVGILKFVILYLSTLASNVAVNYVSLEWLGWNSLLSFLCATGTSTVLNFIGQKWWVFNNERKIVDRHTLLQ